MTIRRCAAAVGAVTLGLLSLSACTKPSPLATVTVGKGSVSSEATCYNDGKPIAANEIKSCLSKAPAQTVTVRPTDQIHLGVDPAIANNGWAIFTDQSQRTDAIKDTYRSFNGSAFFADQSTGSSAKSVELSIVESGGSSGGSLGIWKFKLVQAS